MWQVLVPLGGCEDRCRRYHQALGHQGAEKLEVALWCRFSWPRMGANVRAWSQTCEQCMVAKAGPGVRAPLIPLSSYPLEVVAIDHLSLGCPGDHYPYLLVMTDLFFKYGWAVPVKEQSVETMVRTLWGAVVQHWGCPKRLLSDQEAAFESSLIMAFCELYGCAKLRMMPYHPTGSGEPREASDRSVRCAATRRPYACVQWPRSIGQSGARARDPSESAQQRPFSEARPRKQCGFLGSSAIIFHAGASDALQTAGPGEPCDRWKLKLPFHCVIPTERG
ncbi:hypothetical protein AAFF_G00352180 [Aldrovandia affinis]|uniref:Gypsy retrotransposon integrase-like protein 1 n=1 Tax=Aldrovandia affinis TaxID=143900 RepID=A0AAD7SL50_9TELE|nr:hypothetical protein AAFF_G00352180 [Aldrovandia affinis]